MGCNDCMRLCCVPLIRERSGDFCGIGLVVYELAGKLSRAFSSSACAAFMMAADVFGRVVRFGEPGFPGYKGSGGGARSGSELPKKSILVSYTSIGTTHLSHMGIIFESDDENECECRTSSRSRESSRSTEGIMRGRSGRGRAQSGSGMRSMRREAL
jgi:hypothetical protein